VLSTEENLVGAFRDCELRGRADVLLQIPGGALTVVDYKKSSSKKRVARMNKGFDLQASLYRRMLASWVIEDREIGQVVGVAYYTMNDQLTISDRAFQAGSQVSGVRVIDGDVSREALTLLRKRFRELRAGRIVLNRADDKDLIPKEKGIDVYALDRSPLIALFSHPEAES
jgi:ATP-dependent helicase/nuclease subunit B